MTSVGMPKLQNPVTTVMPEILKVANKFLMRN